MSPAVSVVIPCHNVENWIAVQVGAVLPQLHAEDELVLVDNRSTDGTAKVLSDLADADRRVRVVRAFDRAGANHARNQGLLAARHNVVLFCDADDQVSPGWVEAFRKALAQGGIAGGSATPVDAHHRRVAPDLGLHSIYGGPPYPLGATMGITRDVIECVGGFDESFRGGHDESDLAWRAAAAGWRTVLVPDAHIHYFQRPDAHGLAAQRRHYARTSIQLWARHPDVVDPHGVSLKNAVRGVIVGLPRWWRTHRGTATPEEASTWGWSLGLLEGHLRYRVLGRPPRPIIPSSQEGTSQ